MKIQDLYENEIGDDQIIEILKNKCGVYLSGNNVLYRGMRTTADFYINKVRKDRRPLHSSIVIHDMFDALLHKHNEIKGRSQCVFTSTNANDLNVYGQIRVIFPVGKFHAVSSSKITDLTVDVHCDISDLIRNYFYDLNGFEKYKDNIAFLTNVILNPDDNEETYKALKRTFKTDEYYSEFMEYFSSKTEELFLKYNYINEIQQGVEVMIDCDEYYSMTVETYERIKDIL